MTQSLTLIETLIYRIRKQMVMLDADLAKLYNVETRVLIQSVKRNIKRFPVDFMFQLTKEEFQHLRSQFVISKKHGGRRYPPYAFTEQGVAMLSSVLNSDEAINVNIGIMRTFVKIREVLYTNKELADRLTTLEKKQIENQEQFMIIFDTIRQLMKSPPSKQRKIGFHVEV